MLIGRSCLSYQNTFYVDTEYDIMHSAHTIWRSYTDEVVQGFSQNEKEERKKRFFFLALLYLSLSLSLHAQKRDLN